MSKNPTQFGSRSQRKLVVRLIAILIVCIGVTLLAYALIAETHLSTGTLVNNSIPTATTSIGSYQPEATSDETPSASIAPPATPEAEPESTRKRALANFGIGVGQTLSGLSKAALEAEMDDFVSLGVGWVRFDIDWSEIQPYGSDRYNWQNIDRIVAAANSRDIQILATLSYTPAWARRDGCYSSKCAPADPWQFAHFSREAVERYAPKGVRHWEVWNEPNLVSFWKPEPDVGDYISLLTASYNAIKSVDEDAVVISGGLGPIATEHGNIAPLIFVEELYNQGGGEYFDALGFHPYTFPVPPTYARVWNAWSQMSATNPSIRSIMIAHGDEDKKIWITEFGAPTDGPGTEATLDNYTKVQHPSYVSEQMQALHLEEAITLAEEYEWASPVFWYSYKDLGTSSETKENFFGLRRYDGSKKPAYEALKEILSQ